MSLRTRSEPAPSMPGEPGRRSGSRILFFGLAVVLVAVAVLVAVNIRSDNRPDVTATSTPPASIDPAAPTVDPQAAARAAVIDAYVNVYQGYIAVGKEAQPDLNDPRLTQYSTGTALQAKQESLAANSSEGLVFTGGAELHPTVVELSADSAVVVGCSIDRTGLADARTGAIVEDGGDGQGIADTVELILVDGVWKVNHFKDEKRSCVPPIA